MTFKNFLAGPWLWWRALKDHTKACKAHEAACAVLAAEFTPENYAAQRRAYAATLEPYERVFDNLLPAYVMSCAYILLLAALVARCFA